MSEPKVDIFGRRIKEWPMYAVIARTWEANDGEGPNRYVFFGCGSWEESKRQADDISPMRNPIIVELGAVNSMLTLLNE